MVGAAIAAVFFMLVIFVMLAGLLPVPGFPVQLKPPEADDLPGVDRPTVALAVDSEGRLFFKNKLVTEPDLKAGLAAAAVRAPEPLTLVIHADRAVRYDTLTHLLLLGREAGITNGLLAILPRVTDAPVPK